MVYGIVKLINFAHGEIIMVGLFHVVYDSRLGAPAWAAVLGAVVFCAVLGMVIEKVAYKPLRNYARISLLITAIGVSFFLQNAVQLIFKATPRMFQNIFPGSLKLGGMVFSMSAVVTIVVSVILMIGLSLLVKNTK